MNRPRRACGGRRPIQIGDAEQKRVADLFRWLGGRVRNIGTRQSRGKRCPKCATFVPGDHGTRQARGLADLLIFLSARTSVTRQPLPARFVWFEAKAGSGRLNGDQAEFRNDCLAAGMVHLVGDLDVAIAWLMAEGYVKAESFPHYRQPKGAA